MRNIQVEEGNKKSGEFHGYKWKIVRVAPDHMGHLCGYVEVPEESHLYGLNLKSILMGTDIPVHGGITFSGPYYSGWWLGIDMGHAGDLFPANPHSKGEYRNMAYVEDQLEMLIRGLEEDAKL